MFNLFEELDAIMTKEKIVYDTPATIWVSTATLSYLHLEASLFKAPSSGESVHFIHMMRKHERDSEEFSLVYTTAASSKEGGYDVTFTCKPIGDLPAKKEYTLFDETVDFLRQNKQKAEDITFIGSKDFSEECSWDEFKKLADFSYHSGYGGNEVILDLIIRFKDGSTVDRREYDGSEWWEYTPGQKNADTNTVKLTTLKD